MNTNRITVEIWSDIVCPWCTIGKRRFEKGLESFAGKDQVDVIWRSYQLDPGAPTETDENVNAMLARRKGISVEEAASMNDHVSAMAAAEGLDFRFDRALFVNTFDAHRLIHFAATTGSMAAANERLLNAYFSEGRNIADHDTLIALAVEIGLDADAVRAMLAGDAYTEDVAADVRRGNAFGVRGVPFFIIDEKYAVSGAQSPEIFLTALEQAWSEGHRLVMMEEGGEDCKDGTCRVDSSR